MTRRSGLLASSLLIASLALVAPSSAGASDGMPHLVTGAVQLGDGTWFQIDAQPLPAGQLGKARIAETGASGTTISEISIDCLEVTWYVPVYPIPPYLPFHRAEASGITATGARYFITAYDVVTHPVGFGDRVILETTPGEGACGAAESIGSPVEAGDITIAP